MAPRVTASLPGSGIWVSEPIRLPGPAEPRRGVSNRKRPDRRAGNWIETPIVVVVEKADRARGVEGDRECKRGWWRDGRAQVRRRLLDPDASHQSDSPFWT